LKEVRETETYKRVKEGEKEEDYFGQEEWVLVE